MNPPISLQAERSTTLSLPPLSSTLLEQVEQLRLQAGALLPAAQRARWGQFLTPAPVARLMASLLRCPDPTVSLLDAGAGVGSLLAAVVAQLCQRPQRPRRIEVTAYEIDPLLVPFLHQTLHLCQRACEEAGIAFAGSVCAGDFLCAAADLLCPDLFATASPARYTAAILNPPYRKIHSGSPERALLRQIGLETSNLYTGFVAAAIELLAPGGELVAITPRSFCNGPYFRPFRRFLLARMALERLHLFDTRADAFRGDDVLQETLILHAAKTCERPACVQVSASTHAHDALRVRRVPYAQVVQPDDPEQFLRIVADEAGAETERRMDAFTCTLSDLGLRVSTGRVVDFRARDYLRARPMPDAAPLIYPTHFEGGYVAWPKQTKKPNALQVTEATRALLLPSAPYVLVKRFSAKEETRRLVAVVYDPARLPAGWVGFENHLNVFSQEGKGEAGQGLDMVVAHGLAAYLNSSLLDAFFRQFNGHTQVNATDLRTLTYPSLADLHRLGTQVLALIHAAPIDAGFPSQERLDVLLASTLLPTALTTVPACHE